VGARASIDRAALNGTLRTSAALAAFCLSAIVAGGAGTGPRDTLPGRPFYLPYQYSAFADDTALYSDAYKRAGLLTVGRTESSGVSPGEGSQAGRRGRIRAGTVSHHLFVKDMIARYFIALSRSVHPGTIILIGPNHHARGHSPIALSALSWRTPFGFITPDDDMIRRISETGLARIDEEAFVNEHSIGALAPFVRRTFPEARLVPIIFKKGADRGECAKLGRVIGGLADSALILASLDFSHYLTSPEAEAEDSVSLAVLCSLSENRVDEASVDSRPALLTLISLCRSIGAGTVDVVEHTNSGIVSHNLRVPCTSYINSIIRQ
jgi:MEMO1 family protein